MPKAEISWKKRTPEGERRQLYAQHVGKQWIFHIREKRYDQWQALPYPELEDWLALLDSIRRRAARRLLRPEEVDRVKRTILSLFPEAEVE